MTNLKMPNMSYDNLREMLKDSTGDTKKIAYATHARLSHGDVIYVYHHGNTIAAILPDRVNLSNAGYHTKTTAHRLNLIACANGVGKVYIRDFNMRVEPVEGREFMIEFGPYGIADGSDHVMDGKVTIYK